jgi:hypothetical protein
MPRSAPWLVLALAVTPALATDIPPDPPAQYFPQTSEDNVLENLVTAYRHRDVAEYARLLAADFHVVFPPGHPQGNEERWDRATDSTSVSKVLNLATTVHYTLEWNRHTAVIDGAASPQQPWTRIDADSSFLEVEFPPQPGVPTNNFKATITGQQWFFRRGRTWPPSGPADTLIYVVELREPTEP